MTSTDLELERKTANKLLDLAEMDEGFKELLRSIIPIANRAQLVVMMNHLVTFAFFQFLTDLYIKKAPLANIPEDLSKGINEIAANKMADKTLPMRVYIRLMESKKDNTEIDKRASEMPITEKMDEDELLEYAQQALGELHEDSNS